MLEEELVKGKNVHKTLNTFLFSLICLPETKSLTKTVYCAMKAVK